MVGVVFANEMRIPKMTFFSDDNVVYTVTELDSSGR